MPEVARFYGITIRMFFKPKEHDPSHIHVSYGECAGVFEIQTSKMLDGDLPKRTQELVREWLGIHRRELQEMWDRQEIRQLPPL